MATVETTSETTESEPTIGVPGSSIGRQVVWLAVPVLIEQSLLYLVGLSDTVLTGRYLSGEHLAGVTVAAYLLWTVGSLMTVVSVGATALVARLRGGGQNSEANAITHQAIVMAVAFGLFVLVVGLVAAPWAASAMNLRGPAHAHAVEYFRIVIAVAPLLTITAAGIACLRGAGDTRTGMWVMTLVNLINIALSWGLVRGFGPLPQLGFAGIAIGTAVGEAIGGLVVLAVLFRGRSGLKLDLAGLRPRFDRIRRMLRISVPAFAESATNSGAQLLFLGLINTLGSTATAAHGVAIRCESIAFLTVMAFSVPASTLVGQYLGARRPDLARRSAFMAWGLGMVVLTLMGMLLYASSGPMFAFFLGGGHPEVAEVGVPVMRIVAFAMPALATINVLNGALRGAGDTRWPWFIVMAGYFLVRTPLTVWMISPTVRGGLELGLRGAWFAMLADLNVRGALVAWRFLQGGWARKEV
ncbi:MAG: MATE family efflux transporter [Isosphaeraceae bacterium]|nr:MATE family efflux transporter [Isosphaeraceae bacterium]